MKQAAVLVTGGMGYIGSHTVAHLKRAGYSLVILDQHQDFQSLFSSHTPCYHGHVEDRQLLDKIFTNHAIDTVIHCAASIDVSASTQQPIDYYRNNVATTITLLEAMCAHHVNRIIFSSSAAVYGDQLAPTLSEDLPCAPINPYGMSKLMCEQIITSSAMAYGMQYAILRYFNVAGADVQLPLFECHHPETHLIPLLITAAFESRPFYLFGTDYPTPDGTALRDFVHVSDIAYAHEAALVHMQRNHESACICNIASGSGSSLLNIITLVEQLTNQPITVIQAPRRTGDPAALIADTSAAQHQLNWKPTFTSMHAIIHSAVTGYQRQKANP